MIGRMWVPKEILELSLSRMLDSVSGFSSTAVLSGVS